MLQQTIIAKYDDVGGRDSFCLGIIIGHPDEADGFDVIQAARDAIAEYCATDEGREKIRENNGSFNWGDFVNYVPDEICQKHGFTIVDTFTTDLIVNHDEKLNDPNDD